MKRYLTALTLLSPSFLPAAITIAPPIENWSSANPTAFAETDYKFEVSAPDTLVFNYNARLVYNSGSPLNASGIGEGYTADVSMTPVYNFAGGSGGIVWLEDSTKLTTQTTDPFLSGDDYLGLRYSYTGINATNQIFIEANDSSGNQNTTLAQGFDFDGALYFDVRLDYTGTDTWELSGTISTESATLWDSDTSGTTIINSAVLANDTDDQVYFGAFDATQIGSSALTKLSGNFGAVPEPATVGLLLGIAALITTTQRRSYS